jgi:ABC-2 type transport system permease protein
LRWQLFFNSIRSTRGTVELLSRLIVVFVIFFGGLGGAISLGGATWYFVSEEKTEFLPLLLWAVFMFWQLFPVMATAFTETLGSSTFLRFPLSYSSYFLIQLVYGSFDPATALGTLWLIGITVGVACARATLVPWTVLVLFTFAIVNILLARLVFAWVERWLARRRSREVLGIIFFLMVVGLQFVGPLLSRYGESSSASFQRYGGKITLAQRVSPPGMAAQTLIATANQSTEQALLFFSFLCAYGAAFALALHVRLHAQYQGENLSETAVVSSSSQAVRKRAWNVPGLPSQVGAMLEKELRYLSRSGPMLFTMIMPVVMLLIFRIGPGGAPENEGFLVRMPALAFPVGTMYALLMLTNLVYNNFGADAGGVQFYFVSPLPLSRIVAAKNLSHTVVFIGETIIVWIAVCLLYRPPLFDVSVATISGILFALPVNLAAGNLLSVYSPKKVEYGTFGRQRASWTTVLASFAVQLATFGLGALALTLVHSYGSLWFATLLFLPLAAIALSVYFLVLRHLDRMVLARRETLIAELCRN